MSYAIIGLITVLFLVFAILSAKNLHWVNIVFLILTYIMGVTATIGLSQSLKLRYQATKDLKSAEENLARLEIEASKEINGPPESPEYSPESLRGISEELDRELLGRGRVWKSGTVATGNGNNRMFSFSVSNPDQLQGMIVYAFADGTSNEGVIYPFVYVGTYRVMNQNGQQVELEPIFVASENLANNLDGVTWSLFEKMPVDRRDSFKAVEGITEENFDIDQYREIVMGRLTPEALGLDLNNPDDQAQYEKIIDSFTFDGLPFGTIEKYTEEKFAANQRVSKDFEATPEETFIKFEFDKKTEAKFTVDATANLTEDGNFTTQGLATNPALQAGEKVAFDKGDTVLIDERSAEAFQRNNPVSQVDRVYYRQLKNYPFMLERLQRQTANMAEETRRVRDDITVTESALKDAQSQVKERTDVKNKLASDLESFRNDHDSISALLERRTTQLNEIQNRISQLKTQLDQLYRQISSGAAAVKP